MSRRKLTNGPYDYNDDEDYVPTKKIVYSSKDNNPIHNKKHTLDSDEEDEDTKANEKNYDVLKDEDIDGQEDSTIDFEGETKITPFNMKEEMEEGHFDKDGFYHFKKDKEQLKDAWLDNIDWIKVKHQVDGIRNYGSDEESSDSESHVKSKEENEKEKKEEFDLYEEIFPYIQPQETVSVALKRLGGNKKKRLTTAERWKLKKLGKLEEDSGGSMETFMKLTEVANKIVEIGNMDIYEETYEMINIKIQKYKASQTKVTADPSMDMFSSTTITTDVGAKGKVVEEDTDPINEIKWEYRWEEKSDAEIHGPFTSDQMAKWKDSDYFKSGVFVRKITERAGPWYNSSRIDFDLYT